MEVKKKQSAQKGIPFRAVRIIILLTILLIVGLNTRLTRLRTTDWDHPLWVMIYPINGDGSEASSDYINSLQKEAFDSIEIFLAMEAESFGLTLDEPITIKMAPEISETPPKAPNDGNTLKIMWWSLKMRYWAYVVDSNEGLDPDIKMFVIYYDPKTYKELDHSFGLQKGMIGVVKVFASYRMQEKNTVVITHELLHTLGATDKYDPITTHPVYPDGYAEPDQEPLFPQREAEIMAGRIPINENSIKMPLSLAEVTIGEKTAEEINWTE